MNYDNNMRVFSRSKLNQMFIFDKKIGDYINKTVIENINIYIFISLFYIIDFLYI